MDSSRFRLTFRAKILLALVGTVVLVIGVSLQAINRQTSAQIIGQVERAAETSRRAFAEIEGLRNEELERLGQRFRGIRLHAALEASLADEDPGILESVAFQELEVAGLERGIVAFADADGREVVVLLDQDPHPPSPRAPPDPLVLRLLEGEERRITGYRLYEGVLYSVQVYLFDLFVEPLGAMTLGFALDDAVARRLGEVAGAEVCFVVGNRCLAGTEKLRSGGIASGFDELLRAGAPRIVTTDEGESWALMAGTLEGGESAGVQQVIGVPLDEVLLPFQRIQRTERWVGVGALLLALLVGTMLSRGLTRPIRTLVAATGRVRRGEYDFTVDVPSTDEVGDLADAFNGMLRDLALKEKYRGVLEKVVSRDIAEEMLKGEIRLGGETRNVTTLFADVRGFTSLSEGLASQDIIAMLNEWFDLAAGAVEGEGGVVDKYSGDGLMAVFGAPIALADHPTRAVRAALAMQKALVGLNRIREERGQPPLDVGVGIATGSVVAGNTGSQNRLNYTVLGESVNLAARLCSEAGPGEILVSEAVRASWEEVDAVQGPLLRLKGLSYEVRPWIVRGLGRASPSTASS